MGDIVLIGTMVGFGLGAFHFVHILKARLGQPGQVPAKTIWHALFIWALWWIFGAYVLILWLIGSALYMANVLFRRETGLR